MGSLGKPEKLEEGASGWRVRMSFRARAETKDSSLGAVRTMGP